MVRNIFPLVWKVQSHTEYICIAVSAISCIIIVLQFSGTPSQAFRFPRFGDI